MRCQVMYVTDNSFHFDVNHVPPLRLQFRTTFVSLSYLTSPCLRR